MTDSKLKFVRGDKVFAKMKGYPHWPARIIGLTNESSNNKRYNVYFYGTNQTAVVRGENICSYVENKEKLGKPKKHKYFAEAVLEVEAELNDKKETGEIDITSTTPKTDSDSRSTSVSLYTNIPTPSINYKRKQQKRTSNSPKKLKHKGSNDESAQSSPKKVRTIINIKKQSSIIIETSEERNVNLTEKSVDTKEIQPPLNDPVKESDKEKLKQKDEESNHIIASKSENEKVKIPLNLNRPKFSDSSWDQMVLEYAYLIKKRIESGENLGDIEEHMNEWTAMKSFEFTKKKTSEAKLDKLAFLRTEAQLLNIDVDIKKSLSLQMAEPEKCIDYIDKLSELPVTALMLKKQPEVMHTIRKMRNYVGNFSSWNMTEKEMEDFKVIAKKVRSKSNGIYNKFKLLFQGRTTEIFWKFFNEEVELFREKTSSMTLQEILSLVEEPA